MITNKLLNARQTKIPVERPTKHHPEMTVDEACRLRDLLVQRLIDAGEKIVGYKLSPKTVPSATDTTKLVPVYGYLFESMRLPVGATVNKKDYIDLHLENEVAFIIGKEIPANKAHISIEKPM